MIKLLSNVNLLKVSREQYERSYDNDEYANDEMFDQCIYNDVFTCNVENSHDKDEWSVTMTTQGKLLKL